MFCRSLFVLLYFFFRPLCRLFYFYIRILITPLVSSKSSCSFLVSIVLFVLRFSDSLNSSSCTIPVYSSNEKSQLLRFLLTLVTNMQCIKHTTFETQETTCIEYDGVLFPHEYPGEGAVSQHNRHFLPLTHTFGFIKEKQK